MADQGTDDSLRIEVEVALDKADRDYEAFKKRLESDPIRIGFDTGGGAPGDTRMTRSFGGQMAPGGVITPSATVASSVTAVPTLQQQTQTALIMRGGSPMEGAGYGTFASGRPLPFASTNTFYGQLGYGRVDTAYGSTQALPGREVVPQAPQPVRRRADTLEEVNARYERRVAGEMAATTMTPQTGGDDAGVGGGVLAGLGAARLSGRALGTIGGVVAIARAVESTLGAVNNLRMAETRAGGDPYALARARIDNDVLPAIGRGIPVVGGLAAEAYEYFTGDRAAAERTLAGAQRQDAASQAAADNRTTLRAAQVESRVAVAGLAGGDAAQIAAAQEALGTLGLGTTVTATRTQFSRMASDRRQAASQGLYGAASPAEAQTARDELEAARRQVGTAEGDADAYIAEQRRTQQTQIDQVRQSSRDATASTLTGMVYAGRSAEASMSGQSFEAQRQAIRGETQPAIDQARRRIARLVETNGDQQLVNEADAERARLQQRQNIGLAQADRVEQQFRIGQAGGLAAGRMTLNAQPLDAQIAGIGTRFRQQTLGVNPLSFEFVDAAQRAEQDTAIARQQNRYARLRVGNSLDAESDSLDYGLSRNEVGAQAAAMRGGAINRVQGLFQAGMPDLAEDARNASLKSFDKLAQDYGLSFRGSQFDAQNIFAGNPRDSQDPTEVFRSIRSEQQQVRDARADEGQRDDGTGAGKVTIDATSVRDLAVAIGTELDNRLAK